MSGSLAVTITSISPTAVVKLDIATEVPDSIVLISDIKVCNCNTVVEEPG
jgi:hypothetical protein